MRRLLLYSLALFLTGCLSEKNSDLGTPSTFVKYINWGTVDQGQVVEQTPDGGFIILGNRVYQDPGATFPETSIELIKTDPYGNIEFVKFFPDDIITDSVSFTGRDLVMIKDLAGALTGFAIIGDSIKFEPGSTISKAQLIITDVSGIIVKTGAHGNGSPLEQGRGITVMPNGHLAALVHKSTTDLNMIVMEIDPASGTGLQLGSPVWERIYGAGETTLATRIFANATHLFWGGTVNRTGNSIRLVKSLYDNQGTEFDLPLGDPNFNEQGKDLTPYGQGFAFIGTTNKNTDDGTTFTAGDTEIQWKKISGAGQVLNEKLFGFRNQDESAYSISTTSDGGVILLGGVNTHVQTNGTKIGRGGQDYFLIKIGPFGDPEWQQIFGSKNDDFGACVRQLPDGSFIALGTTVIGGVSAISLIKTNAAGDVE